mmetsp:Transcript_43546/g.100257  ORF Transcript_43546/g.100257 Transcript_43546/m.100257 type:complete len:366 (-) Transcript_43546:43-1140(-)
MAALIVVSMRGGELLRLQLPECGMQTVLDVLPDVASALAAPLSCLRLISSAGEPLRLETRLKDILQASNGEHVVLTCVAAPPMPLERKFGEFQRGGASAMRFARLILSRVEEERAYLGIKCTPDDEQRGLARRVLQEAFAKRLHPFIDACLSASSPTTTRSKTHAVVSCDGSKDTALLMDVSTCRLWTLSRSEEPDAQPKKCPLVGAVLFRVLDGWGVEASSNVKTGPVLEVLFHALRAVGMCPQRSFPCAALEQILLPKLDAYAAELGCVAIAVVVRSNPTTRAMWARDYGYHHLPCDACAPQESEDPATEAAPEEAPPLDETASELAGFLSKRVLLYNNMEVVCKMLAAGDAAAAADERSPRA